MSTRPPRKDVTRKKKRSPKKPKRALRTYRLAHDGNAGKVAQVAALLPEFQATCRVMQAWQYQRMLSGEGLWNRANPKPIPSNLSERFKRSCLNQVVAGLRSWEETTKIEISTLIRDSSLAPDMKQTLWRVNAAGTWFQRELKLAVMVTDPVSGKSEKTDEFFDVDPALLRLLRLMVRHVRKHRNRLPNLGKSRTMMLDATVAQFEQPKTGTFDYWVRISTLTPHKPVRIPLHSNRFAETADGTWAPLTQITVNRNGSIEIKQVKEAPLASALRGEDGPEVGLDFGMVSLFATSAGDLLGHSLYPWLQRIDAQLCELAANLQRQSIKPFTSKRYRAFQARIREHVRNEISRCLNKIIDIHGPNALVVENLDFRHGGLSRRLNRMLARCGRSAIKTKLESLEETQGVATLRTPSYYSSRECSGCGYETKTNRKTRSQFVCGFCGKTCHADINAARVTKSRRSWPNSDRISKTQALRKIDTTFEQRWGIHPDSIRTRARQRSGSITTPNHRRAKRSLPAVPAGTAPN